MPYFEIFKQTHLFLKFELRNPPRGGAWRATSIPGLFPNQWEDRDGPERTGENVLGGKMCTYRARRGGGAGRPPNFF